jgi:hypothetical protein
MSNLNDLNSILFKTLKDLQEGNIDNKKATAIVGVSNSIINNGKLQLNAFKMHLNQNTAPEIFGLKQENIQVEEKVTSNLHELMTDYAIFLKHKNVASAIAKVGKAAFMEGFKEWNKN